MSHDAGHPPPHPLGEESEHVESGGALERPRFCTVQFGFNGVWIGKPVDVAGKGWTTFRVPKGATTVNISFGQRRQ